MKPTSGRSVFQNMAMKCFIFVFCWQRKEKKKNFTKKQFNTRLKLFKPSVTRDCTSLTMEQIHVKKEKEKEKGSVMSGSEAGGCYINMVAGLAQCRTSFFYTNWTWSVWWSGDQRVKENHPAAVRRSEALGTSFWKRLCFSLRVVANNVTPAAWFSDGRAWKYWYLSDDKRISWLFQPNTDSKKTKLTGNILMLSATSHCQLTNWLILIWHRKTNEMWIPSIWSSTPSSGQTMSWLFVKKILNVFWFDIIWL